MREFLTDHRDANKIRLLRSTHTGTFLLVEGDSDKKFYGRFIDPNTCQLVIISGKPSSKQRIIDVLQILEKDNFLGVVAIVDADFDHLEVNIVNHPNLLRTDTHDLETMLIQSPAFDKVLTEFGSEDKISQFSEDIRQVLVQSGTSIGYLRWISVNENLNLKFEGLAFKKFINEDTLKIDELKLIEEVKNKSQKQSLKNETLQKVLIEKYNPNDDPWQVCCGHDLVAILSLGLGKAIGSEKSQTVTQESLERSLRLAYEEIHFKSTQLYLDLSVWEENHPPFKIFPQY